MSNKMHPADAIAIQAARNARSFSVSVFKGATHHGIIEFADAIEAGRLMENIDRSGRKSIVYAITQEGASVMIPRALYPIIEDHSLMENEAMTTPQAANGVVASARRSGAMSAIAALKATTTPAPDAGKKSTTVDLTEKKSGLPAFLDATDPKNADARNQARARPLPAVQPKADAAKADGTSQELPMSRASFARQISAAPSSKAGRVAAAQQRKTEAKRRDRPMSPDAIKPIVPLRGPAQAEFLASLKKAEAGHLPSAPDFSADTHKPYREELKALVALAKAGDLDALKADKTQPTWTSRTMIVRYRTLAIRAIEADKKVKNPTVIPGLDKVLKAIEADAPKTDKTAPASSKKRSVSEAASNRKAAIAADKAKKTEKKK